jgi:hypothetical protein
MGWAGKIGVSASKKYRVNVDCKMDQSIIGSTNGETIESPEKYLRDVLQYITWKEDEHKESLKISGTTGGKWPIYSQNKL